MRKKTQKSLLYQLMIRPKYLLLIFFYLVEVGISKEIAITFDDFPMEDSSFFTKQERVELFLKKLRNEGIQAAFFCIGNQFETDCMQRVDEEGHLLCNHSFHHLHLSEISLEEFKREIEESEVLLSEYGGYRKWFRFPYLDYGDRKKNRGQ